MGCKTLAQEPEPAPADAPSGARAPTGRWRPLAVASGMAVLIGGFLGVRVSFNGPEATAARMASAAVTTPLPPRPAEPDPSTIPFGPDLPPPDFFHEGEVWFHPLPGPLRRMPERPTRRFGVERDHDSPESCRQGHCGCDIGEVRGEPVLAVHDGVVERVVRESDGRSGRYVRLIHRNGTIVTQYMHLDDVADLKPGMRVRAGDKLGTVGGTGVLHSEPHLHFTVAVRTKEDAPEVYLDPEPLLALWPMFQH